MLAFLFTKPADVPAKAAGKKRSPHWAAVRLVHLTRFPRCAACGGKESLNVHHKRPFHLFPSLELEPSNLITLCEAKGLNCHLLFGHLRMWASYNPAVGEDAATWLGKIRERP